MIIVDYRNKIFNMVGPYKTLMAFRTAPSSHLYNSPVLVSTSQDILNFVKKKLNNSMTTRHKLKVDNSQPFNFFLERRIIYSHSRKKFKHKTIQCEKKTKEFYDKQPQIRGG